jgi:hypothetical protein
MASKYYPETRAKARGQERRHQHDVFDLAGRQRISKRRLLHVVVRDDVSSPRTVLVEQSWPEEQVILLRVV